MINYVQLLNLLAQFGITHDDPEVIRAQALLVEVRLIQPDAPLADLAADYGNITTKNLKTKLIKAAVEASAAGRLHEAQKVVVDQATRAIRAYFKENRDPFTRALKDAFSEAGETLAFIAEKVGLDLDPRVLVSLPTESYAAYKDLDSTIKVLDSIRSVVTDLDEIAGAGRPEVERFVSVNSPEELQTARMRYAGNEPGDIRGQYVGTSPWLLLANAGTTLELHTDDEAVKMVAEIAAIAAIAEAESRRRLTV